MLLGTALSLRRNIEQNPHVSLLFDRWSEQWIGLALVMIRTNCAELPEAMRAQAPRYARSRPNLGLARELMVWMQPMRGTTARMKALLIGVILVLLCLVLFLVGAVSPRRSRKMQARVDGIAKKGERHGDNHAGRLGDATRGALEKSRAAADASANAGRRVHEAANTDRK